MDAPTPMDPAAYDEDAYRTALLRKMQRRELVAHHAAFAPADVSKEPVLLAATSTGHVHVFELARVLRPEYWEESDEASRMPSPSLSFEAHPTQIYTIAFAGDAQDPLVVTGGDQDFRVWRWKDIAAALRDPTPRLLQPVHVGHLDRMAMGYRGALLPFSEINAIATTSTHSNRVFLAGGDGIAHEFDLTTPHKCVSQFRDGHSDYLHAVQFVNHSQELVTGSEDGTVCIWDARAARRIEVLTPQPKSQAATAASGNSSRWVGSVATDASESWLACGGGSKTQGANGGFLSMWHLPSRVPVHYTETQAGDVHDLAYYHTDLLTVGNDSSLKKWNRSSGALLSTARTNVPSAQFCVVDAASDLIVLGGYASRLDVCMMPGVVSFSLTLDTEA